MSECCFVVESLGSGGISEAASLGDSSYSLQLRRARDSPLPRLRDARGVRMFEFECLIVNYL